MPTTAAQTAFEVRVTAPGLDVDRAHLCHSGDGEWHVHLVTSRAFAPGTFVPIQLHHDSGESLSTMCKVDAPAPGKATVRLRLPEDAAVVQRVLRWAARAADGPERHHAVLPRAHGTADEIDLGEAIVAVEPVADEIDLDEAILAVAPAAATSSHEARLRAEAALTRAVAAERDGDFQKAYACVQEALHLYPVNAARLHLRLARLSLDKLSNFQDAFDHVQAALALDPSDPDLHRFMAELRGQRTMFADAARTAAVRKAATAGRTRALLAVIGLVLAVVGVAAANYLIWIAPRGKAPNTIAPSEVADVVSATEVRSHRGALFVTTERWSKLDAARKAKALEGLAARARARYSLDRVVVVSTAGLVLGTFEDGQATVIR